MKRYRKPVPNPVLVALGAAIKKRRRELGWTQEEAAEASGVHPNYFSDTERGLRNVGFINLISIANGLKISPIDLLKNIKYR
jgi:transcriptional regulator with XRE-family HTH domain